VVLRLRLTPGSEQPGQEAWRRVLEGKYPLDKSLLVSVAGRAPGDPRLRLATKRDDAYVRWTPWSSTRSYIALGFALATVLLSVVLVAKHFSLRDAPGPGQDPAQMLFSLSKSQMLLWIVTVPVALLLVWAMTGVMPALSASVIALLMVGIGTKLASGIVDTSGAATVANLQAQHAALTTQLGQVNTQLAATGLTAAQTITLQQRAAGLQIQIDTLAQRIAALQTAGAQETGAPVQPQSKGWWADVLSDGAGGIGLHRLQLLLWTGVVWLLFGAHVLRNLVIPELDATLVTLSGLSSASFVILKSREPN
jgi:hypothetical protein